MFDVLVRKAGWCIWGKLTVVRILQEPLFCQVSRLLLVLSMAWVWCRWGPLYT